MYYNSNFCRDQPDNLHRITREKIKEVDIKHDIDTLLNSLKYLANAHTQQQSEIEELKEKVNKLEIKNQTLCEIVGNAMRTGM